MTDSLEKIAEEVRHCTRCRLYQGTTHGVPGEGPVHAEIMLIGEAPGFHEDRQGRPFVGAAGQFLDELLASAGLKRADVFITNVVKHRPPSNRDPMPDEIEACKVYLDRQLALIQPKVIITLGRHSMARWFPSEKISVIHGQPRAFGGMLVIPMYHPAAALHQPALRRDVEEDFRKIPAILDALKKKPAPPASGSSSADSSDDPEDYQQLSLF